MKITNYKLGYNTIFDCSVHGTITMTKEEFRKALPIIKKHCAKDFNTCITKNYYIHKGIQYYNFGVTATSKLVDTYKLSNYKPSNYQIKVICK